jgi:hypothetical protein
LIADCVAHAPGGPVHVLLTHRKAEHIPGCNMAFRKVALKAIAGFDPQFHVAGDDVDMCWRLQAAGLALGFSPAAVVWHHRRNSVRAYWRQQKGYGKAEAMLERKWPEKYNLAGQAVWSGRVYTNGLTYTGWRARRIYHGIWGTAPFQSLYEPAPSSLEALPMMPEWYLIIVVSAALSLLGLAWRPLLLAVPVWALCVAVSCAQAIRCAKGAAFRLPAASTPERWQRRALTALLYLLQPLARLQGRVRHGLTFWRRQPALGYALPCPWTADIWTKGNQTIEERLSSMERRLRRLGFVTGCGSDFDRWDLDVTCGLLGSARLHMAVEKHGSGRELLRIRCRPRASVFGLALCLLAGGLGWAAALDGAWVVCGVLWTTVVWILVRLTKECSGANAAFLTLVRRIERLNPQQEK